MSCSPWVLDASSIIDIKKVSISEQWDLLKRMEKMVEDGRLVFPREAGREVKAVLHPDAPGVWVAGVERKLFHPRDPAEDVLRDVLRIAGDVVDIEKQLDGDPYVLALARELTDSGHISIVVTEDVNDRPSRIAMTTACSSIQLHTLRLPEILSTARVYS